MLLAERECDFFAAHGKMENDREARNFPSAARNIVELGRRQQLSPLEERGRAAAERMCPQCHAIGKSGQSPHVGALPFVRSTTESIWIFYGAAARRPYGRPSGYADVSFHARRRACVLALSEVHSG